MGKDLPEEISFGEWVHQRRRLLDLTQQELADQVGCARITLRRIESGALKPSKELALILLDKLRAPQTEREAWLRFARGLSGVPGQPSDFPANKPRINLPTALTSFIGREKEREEVAQLLKSNRLVTLTGTGGIGKTRLSIQTASSMLNQFPDGTWLVELAPLSDPALVPVAIVKTLGLIEQAGRPPQTILTDFLQAKNLLLVLDNCEHLIQACAALAEKLLQSCPHLYILATSREALGIPGEAVYLVPSLNTPDPLHPNLDTLSQSEAARLFMERALLAQSHFAITDENAPAIVQICHRLDGIPLAIELAAARLRMLSTEQIAARLDDRFRLLTGGSRTALPRQQTLRAMIDWSYDLLSENEKLLLRRLAVFAGGWSLELAEQVCSGDKIDSYEILNMLARLVDKSLVAVEEDKTGTRYHILETVRQYAREKLFESGEDTTVRAKHRDVYLEFVERIEPELIRGHQKKWMDVLEAEHDNLRAALSWSLENEHAEQALRFCSALFNFWSRRRHLVEAAQVCKEALACSLHSESSKTTTWYASVLFASAFFVNATEIKQWSHPSIRALLEQARQIYDAIDAYNSIGAVLASLYLLSDIDTNSFAWAEKCLSDLYERVRAAGYPYGMALVKQSMGFLSLSKGDRVSAMVLLQESSELFVQVEDVWAVQDLSIFFINQKFLRGEMEDGTRLAEESLLFFQDYGDLTGVASCYLWLGSIAREQGHYETAWHYFTDAVSLSKVMSDRWGQVFIGERIPYLLYLEGKVDEARVEYEAVLTQLKDVPNDSHYGFFHARFAQICLHENRLEEARKELVVGLAVLQKTAPENNIYVAYYGLGELARLEGNFSEAIENYLASLRVLSTSQFYIAFPDTLNGLAKTGLLQSKLEYAARLFGASEALCEKLTIVIHAVDRPDYDKHVELLKSKMSAEEFESAWAEGAKMSLEEAYEYALQESE